MEAKPRAGYDPSGADRVGGQEVTIERAESDDELAEFWLFANEVYAQRAAHWRTTSNDVSPLLKGDGPGAAGRTTSALVARSRWARDLLTRRCACGPALYRPLGRAPRARGVVRGASGYH